MVTIGHVKRFFIDKNFMVKLSGCSEGEEVLFRGIRNLRNCILSTCKISRQQLFCLSEDFSLPAPAEDLFRALKHELDHIC